MSKTTIPKNVGNVLIGVGVALIVSFLFTLSAPGDGAGRWAPILVGTICGVFTTYILGNLAGNRKVEDADAETRRRALAFEPPAPGRSALYMVRGGFVGRAAGMNVALDGREVVQLKSPRFTRIEIAPGQHTLRASFGGGLKAQTNARELTFNAPPDEIVVLRLSLSLGALKNSVTITPFPPTGMRAEIQSMRMVKPDVAAS